MYFPGNKQIAKIQQEIKTLRKGYHYGHELHELHKRKRRVQFFQKIGIGALSIAGIGGAVKSYPHIEPRAITVGNELEIAVSDNPHMVKYVAIRAHGKVLNAEVEHQVDDKIIIYDEKYLTGNNFDGKTWLENYQIAAKETLRPENAGNRAMLKDFADLTGQISKIEDKELLKKGWQALVNLNNALGAGTPKIRQNGLNNTY